MNLTDSSGPICLDCVSTFLNEVMKPLATMKPEGKQFYLGMLVAFSSMWQCSTFEEAVSRTLSIVFEGAAIAPECQEVIDKYLKDGVLVIGKQHAEHKIH